MNKAIQHIIEDFDFNNIKTKRTNDWSFYLNRITVDMGLPSRTRWFKYNLGVDPQLLNNPSDWYGDYYAWGETITNKLQYSWETYKFFKKESYEFGRKIFRMFKKYQAKPIDAEFDYCDGKLLYEHKLKIDNLVRLQSEDDIATIEYGNSVHIPTKDQWQELLKNTTHYCVSAVFNKDGVGDGIVLKSKTNGNTLFFPASGYFIDFQPCRTGPTAYWSSNLNCDKGSNTYAHNFVFDLYDRVFLSSSHRYHGLPIRPVLEP